MARMYQTRALNDQLSPSIEEFEMMAMEAYAHLPEDFRTLAGEIVILVAEFPTEEIMDDLARMVAPGLRALSTDQVHKDRNAISITVPPSIGNGPRSAASYCRSSVTFPDSSCRRSACGLIVRALQSI